LAHRPVEAKALRSNFSSTISIRILDRSSSSDFSNLGFWVAEFVKIHMWMITKSKAVDFRCLTKFATCTNPNWYLDETLTDVSCLNSVLGLSFQDSAAKTQRTLGNSSTFKVFMPNLGQKIKGGYFDHLPGMTADYLPTALAWKLVWVN
jgi:hypothetical protein